MAVLLRDSLRFVKFSTFLVAIGLVVLACAAAGGNNAQAASWEQEWKELIKYGRMKTQERGVSEDQVEDIVDGSRE